MEVNLTAWAHIQTPPMIIQTDGLGPAIGILIHDRFAGTGIPMPAAATGVLVVARHHSAACQHSAIRIHWASR